MMKTIKYTLFLAVTMFVGNVGAQIINIQEGEVSSYELEKDVEHVSFQNDGKSYHVTSKFENVVMNYYLEAYDASGSNLASTKLEINGGVFNDAFGIIDILPLGNKVYAAIENASKPNLKNTLHLRVMDDNGDIAENGTEAMNFPIEKIMNGGYYFTASSNDHSKLAVVALLPFEKKIPGKVKLEVYDENLKSIASSTFEIPGEDTKNKHIDVQVANDGTVYLIRRIKKMNGTTELTVFQCSGSGMDKEYSVDIPEDQRINNYIFNTNDNNELIIAGTYYKFTNVVVGDQKMNGIFYFVNEGKNKALFSLVETNNPVENLFARSIKVNGNTIFVIADNYKVEKISPAGADPSSFNYTYNHYYKDLFVIALEASGTKKFEISIPKDFKVVNNNSSQYEDGYFICNGALTILYNDEKKKYTDDAEHALANLVPIMVQITNDGLMENPIPFIDKLKIQDYYIMYPSYSTQVSENEIGVLARFGKMAKYLGIKVED